MANNGRATQFPSDGYQQEGYSADWIPWLIESEVDAWLYVARAHMCGKVGRRTAEAFLWVMADHWLDSSLADCGIITYAMQDRMRSRLNALEKEIAETLPDDAPAADSNWAMWLALACMREGQK